MSVKQFDVPMLFCSYTFWRVDQESGIFEFSFTFTKLTTVHWTTFCSCG